MAATDRIARGEQRPLSDDNLVRVSSETSDVMSPALTHRPLARRHTVGQGCGPHGPASEQQAVSRRRSIDQVLTSRMDSKQKEAIFDSPKLLNKHQRALSRSGGLMFVGNYRIGDTVGKGRYSVVKLATHVLTNEFVALKIVNKAKLSREDMRVLQREMQIMKLLDHPNIVKLYEVIDTPEHFYLVLEYVKGRTFSDKLPEIFKMKKKKRTEVIKRIFSQLASAVAYCHKEHVVHRDIKTDNLMMEEDGTVKLADWGFSNLSSDLLHTHCGTPYYASPELFRPEAYQGPPSDVWAMGVLLFYMFVGKLPFHDDPIREYIKTSTYRMPKDVPSDLASLIASMLRVNPDTRLTAAAVCQHKWLTGTDACDRPAAAAQAPLVGTTPNTIHADAIELMIQHLGFTEEEIMRSLDSNSYDQVAATYYLLRDSPKLDEYRKHLLTPAGAQTTQSNNQQSTISSDSEGSMSLVRRLSRVLGGGGVSSPSGGSANGTPTPGSPSSGHGSPSRRRSQMAARMVNFLLSPMQSSARRTSVSSDSNSQPGSPAPRATTEHASPLRRFTPSPSGATVPADQPPPASDVLLERRRSRLSAIRSAVM